ncbi:hypothetical protein [Thermodesulfitimonas autotrophica]|uniref:hypothetical protein n=1 Tax=Thermodesulfitimonas autotrophica TaxID=1894989 RepID=UPI002FE0278E
MLLWRAPGSVPVALGRPLAVAAWVGAALAALWVDTVLLKVFLVEQNGVWYHLNIVL